MSKLHNNLYLNKLLQCRAHAGPCPWGGSVAETVSRERGTPEERAEAWSKRWHAARENPGSVIPRTRLSSSGEGKHIRKESRTEHLALINLAIERAEEENTRKRDEYLPATPGAARFAAFKPGASQVSKNGMKTREALKAHATGGNDLPTVLAHLQRDSVTRDYFYGIALETRGDQMGHRKIHMADTWGDLELKHDFRTRLNTNGTLIVFVPDATTGGERGVPVGSIREADFMSGQYLKRVDKVMDRFSKRKTPVKDFTLYQRAFEEEFQNPHLDMKEGQRGKGKPRKPKVEPPVPLQEVAPEVPVVTSESPATEGPSPKFLEFQRQQEERLRKQRERGFSSFSGYHTVYREDDEKLLKEETGVKDEEEKHSIYSGVSINLSGGYDDTYDEETMARLVAATLDDGDDFYDDLDY